LDCCAIIIQLYPRTYKFERLWLPLKGISIKKQIYYPISITITSKYSGYLRIVFGDSDVIDTAGAKIGNFMVENLHNVNMYFSFNIEPEMCNIR
jgi:hypothetical protein